MDAGVASLLGAAVGASASLGATAYAERTRRIRDEQARKFAEAQRSAAATRLVQDELRWSEAPAGGFKNRRYWSRRYALEDELWRVYREAIALALPRDGWDDIARAFTILKTVELQADRNRPKDPLSTPLLDDWGAKGIEEGLGQVHHAIEILDPFTEVGAPR